MKNNIEITSKSQHERELTITVEKDIVEQQFNKTLNKIQKTASRPGFRPGKMPKNMVLNFYGQEIKSELLQNLIESTLDNACEKNNLIPVSKPSLEPIGQIKWDEPFTYKAIFQVKPQIEDPKFKELNLEIKEFSFTDKDIEQELENLRENQATFVEPKDRDVITPTDMVGCDSVVKVDGEINENYSHKDYSVPLFAENVPQDLRDALVGKKIGDIASVNYTMPEDHQDEAIKGKTCEMVLTITSIKERVLPKLDDDFAKDLSDKFNSLDELKESVRMRFNITVKRRNEFFKQDAITKALVENNSLEVPPALVERTAMSLLNRELESVPEATAKDMVQKHWKELWDSVQERAVFRTKAELLLESVIKISDIKVSEEEIDARVKKIEKTTKEDAEYSIGVEKVLKLIEENATVKMINEPLFGESK